MVVFAVLCAALTSVCYGVGSVLQAVAAGRARTSGGLDLKLLWGLARSAPYLLGMALDALGFLASLVALRSLPLFLVQAVIASSVGVTALVAWRFLHVRLARRDAVGVVVLVSGLALLGLSAQPAAGDALPSSAGWWGVAGIAVVASTGALAARMPTPAAQTARR